ncbi:MAG: glycosyltransferase family 2 protein [Candidatus Calescibacterium sp.]|nr:glycosyltransferase family 2 protein [Candidatus Calescibacterium sp.]MCX7972792.1 glycosyltransferase family 2 protein [bacterium]MDW8195866.1 glycosyltransferase family 2 protein [Candidatus Calescibacterium sp.]
MLASIVIPTYNRSDVLLKTFRYWEKQTIRDFEIIIIDDNSSDGTYEKINEYLNENRSLNIRVIRNNMNMGSADGRNKGALYSKSEIIIYTDDDAFPTPNFVERHIYYHRKYPNAIVRGPIINFSDLSFLEIFFLPNHEIKRKIFLAMKGYSGNYFCTANVSIRKELIYKVGFFDLDFNRWQDTEFGYRLRKMGIVRFFDFQAWVLHYKQQYSDPYRHFYNEGKYAAKLLKYYPNLSVKLRTGYFPFFPIWQIFYNAEIFTYNKHPKLGYIKGFLEEYKK